MTKCRVFPDIQGASAVTESARGLLLGRSSFPPLYIFFFKHKIFREKYKNVFLLANTADLVKKNVHPVQS